MTEQLNQVYAYLLKIEEASRKEVTGIQFAFEAGGYAKAAMAICESALNWPKHSNVEVQAERKTGFDFGATRKRPDVGDIYFTPLYDVCPPDEIQTPTSIIWDNLSCEEKWLKDGKIFTDKRQCKAYCDYLNSLTNEN